MKYLFTLNLLFLLWLQFGRTSAPPPRESSPDPYTQRLHEIATELDTHPDTLTRIFEIESGGNHTARNKWTGATGLIQFMPATAREMGTDTAALVQMSATEQLDYVLEYLRPAAGSDVFGFYLQVFFPAAKNKPETWVLQTSNLSAEMIAKRNPIFDLNNDRKIQVYEIRHYLNTNF